MDYWTCYMASNTINLSTEISGNFQNWPTRQFALFIWQTLNLQRGSRIITCRLHKADKDAQPMWALSPIKQGQNYVTSFGHKKVRTGSSACARVSRIPRHWVSAGRAGAPNQPKQVQASETRSRKHCIALLVGKSPLLASLALLYSSRL